MSRSLPPARARRWRLWGCAVVALAGAAVAVGTYVWRAQRWQAELQQVRFLDHPEKISAGSAALTVQGYVVATVGSDVDFFALAHADGAHPKVEASLCDSDTDLSAWTDPLPLDVRAGDRRYSYAVLVPIRGESAAWPRVKFDLSTGSEDICLRFLATATAPQTWIRSRSVVVPLGRALREQLAAYAGRGGELEIELDPSCVPLLCQPDFKPGDLQH